MVRPAVTKRIDNAFSFLENQTIRTLLIVILCVYNSALFEGVNRTLSTLLNNIVGRVVMLLLIVTVGAKDPLLGLLLGIALVMTVFYGSNYSVENLTVKEEADQKLKNLKLGATINAGIVKQVLSKEANQIAENSKQLEAAAEYESNFQKKLLD